MELQEDESAEIHLPLFGRAKRNVRVRKMFEIEYEEEYLNLAGLLERHYPDELDEFLNDDKTPHPIDFFIKGLGMAASEFKTYIADDRGHAEWESKDVALVKELFKSERDVAIKYDDRYTGILKILFLKEVK